MTYRRFKIPESSLPPATLATFATLRPSEPPSVATVANVAGHRPERTPHKPPSVANVTNVAGAEPDSAFAALVPADDVLAMFEGASSRLMAGGRSRAEAAPEALSIVRAKLRDDPRLADIQVSLQCFICGDGDRENDCLVPFLSARPDRYYWMHAADCHAEHCRRQAQKTRACLRAAGLIKHTNQETKG